MRKISILAISITVLVGVVYAQAPQQKGGGDITGPYDVVAGWPQNWCGAGFQIGSTAGIWAETPDRVMIFARGCLPALKDPGEPVPTRNASGYSLARSADRHPRWDHIVNFVDRNGRLIESWEQHNKLFVRPHRILVNPHDPAASLLARGRRRSMRSTSSRATASSWSRPSARPGYPATTQTHFARPTDIALMADGTFFVSDGYTNTRVVKFDRNGKYVTQLGDGRQGPRRRDASELLRHGARDRDRQAESPVRQRSRALEASRSSTRTASSSRRGRTCRVPYSLLMTDDQFLWSASGQTQKFTKYDLNGKLLSSWGTFGTMPGAFWGVHQFDVDSEGNLYTADVHVGRPQKFRPRPGVDRAQLIGRATRGR